MKIRSAIAAITLLALGLMTAQGAAAKPKGHFLKSKKFWTVVAGIAIPGTTSGILATRTSGPPDIARQPGTTAPGGRR